MASRLFDAPRALVFRMWTEPEHVAQWWGPRGFHLTIHEMDVRPGGTWRFVLHGPDGTDYRNTIIYREIVPPERLAYSHVSGPLFEALATFDEEAGGTKTRVTVRMEFESAAKRDEVARQFGAVEGLQQTLERLEETLVREATPFVISRTFDAPRALVFAAWTETERLKQWWGPKGFTVTHAVNDLRPGGSFHYCMRAADGAEMWGKWIYREITAPERLVFLNSFSDPDGGVTHHPMAADWPLQMLLTVTLTERDRRTTVAIESVPFRSTDEERATFDANHPSMQNGWSGTLEQLATHLEHA